MAWQSLVIFTFNGLKTNEVTADVTINKAKQ